MDQLTSSKTSTIPSELLDNFSPQTCSSPETLPELLKHVDASAIFFDFDYPDRRRLSAFADTKNRFSSIPIVMLTLQHSESLAVWAFRHGALDYLVKPIDNSELRNCVERILEISRLRNAQQARSANHSKPRVPVEIPHTARENNEKLAPAIYFVQQNYSQRIYSDAMARLCGMSATHFSRAFKNCYQVTFQEFLLRYRVRQARRKLHGPLVNIADVAYSVGFSDPSYFTRVFKRYIGVSPSDYAAGLGEGDKPESVGDEDKMSSSSQIVRRLSASFSA